MVKFADDLSMVYFISLERDLLFFLNDIPNFFRLLRFLIESGAAPCILISVPGRYLGVLTERLMLKVIGIKSPHRAGRSLFDRNVLLNLYE